MTIERPLTGITIIEAVDPAAPAALALAAGMCGRIACDLGARVIRLESEGDRLLRDEDFFLNNGKVRVKTSPNDFAQGLKVQSENADCVITDAGFWHAVHAKTNAVVLAMSIDDPLGGSEFTLEARSGLLDLVGDPKRQPLRLGGHQIPYAAGAAAYTALAELLTVGSGGGAAISRRVDLLDIAIWLNWKAIGGAALHLPDLHRAGNDGSWSVAACKDGYVALVYRSSDWDALKRMLQDARLDNPQFETEADRTEHRAALNAILREAIAPLTRAEIRLLALQFRLPLGPVWTPKELLSDPHFVERNFFHTRSFDDDAHIVPAIPVKWSGRTFTPADGAERAAFNN